MSKELKALERIYCHLPQIDGDRFKQDKENIEKSLKALKIIKELFNLRIYEKQGQFFICSGVNGETPISKEKTNLLKEILL